MKLLELTEAFDDTTTGMPGPDEIMRGDPEYQRNWKRTQFHIERMSPDEYLRRAASGFGDSVERMVKTRQARLADEYAEKMKGGAKFPMPVLDYRHGDFSQEGIHRAMAAKKAGIKEMPVMILTTATPDDEA